MGAVLELLFKQGSLEVSSLRMYSSRFPPNIIVLSSGNAMFSRGQEAQEQEKGKQIRELCVAGLKYCD